MLVEGWNTVTITDVNLCEVVDSVLIGEPTPFVYDHLSQDATCFGASDGVAIIDVDGGTDPYEYAWGDPLNQTGNQASNLPAAIYTVTVTDDNNCTGTYDIEIDQPGEIMTNVVGSNIPCANDNNGSGEVMVMGGSNPYSFLWSSGEIVNPAVQLSAGWNYVTVTDNKDCTTVDSVLITAPEPIEIEFVETPISCFGLNDGMLEIIISGGQDPYEISLNGIVTTSPIVDMEADIYCFTITDFNNCVIDTCYEMVQPDELTWFADVLAEKCLGSSDGSIDITVNNGIDPLQYSWTGPLSYTSFNEDNTGLLSGWYYFTVTDDNLCELSDSIELEAPDVVDISAITFNIACKGEDSGLINITVEGGEEPFDFSWSGPNGFTSNQEDLLDIAAGEYNLIFEDANGCIIQKIYEIVEPITGINSGISENDTICYDAINGIASVTPSGGTMPHNILWSTGSNLTSVNSLAPGIYTVTITDGSLCKLIDTVEIVELDEIELTLEQVSSLCNDSSDGSASVTEILYGTTNSNLDDFSYLWNSFPIQITSDAVNLKGGGTYTVVVTDDLGCSVQSSITVDNPIPVSAELTDMQEIKCANGEDGILLVEGRGGTGDYEYQWGQGTNFQEGPQAKDLIAGLYLVTITDSNGCTGVEEFYLQDPFPISLDYRIFDVLCKGDESGEIELIANGGTEPYSFNWSTGDDDDVIDNLVSGFYYITVEDDNGCIQEDSVFLDEPLENLDFNLSLDNVSCNGGQDGRIIIEAMGGAGNYIYSIDNIIYNGAIEQIGLKAGSYTVYVKDGNGCLDSLPSVEIFEPAPITLDLGGDIILRLGENYQFDPVITNFALPLIFEWKSADLDLLTCTDCPDPFFNAIRQATYKLIIIDGEGCITEDFINIYLEDFNEVVVPTAFTPNGDFNNDLLSVFGVQGIRVLSFKVFDRWGEKVYENADFDVNDTSVGWDGMFRGKAMDPGVFTWVVEAESNLGFKEIFKGNTSLIR